ncbi:MAG: response regulator [Desulfomonilia bacterium]|nr:response regulator [Deltaproteobacteria bacterium]HPW69036.1 response regulator [Deltaproteobacteria bacterium]
MPSPATHDNFYNVKLLRTYLEYIKHKYPDLDIDTILDYTGISRSQVDDDGFWYGQEISDRFHEILDRMTGNENLAREVGRYGASSASMGTIKQYIVSFLDPLLAYELLERIGSKLTKGTAIQIRKLSSHSVEAIYTLNPGVKEKPYQCQNRYGLMESVATFFTGVYAKVEHKECIHEGYNHCRYIISWEKSILYRLKQIRSFLILFGLIAGFFIAFSFSLPGNGVWLASLLAGILGLSCCINKLEINLLKNQVQYHGQAAEKLFAESDKRYRDAELIHEVGKVISTELDIGELLETLMDTVEKYFDYDRGMVLLADNEKIALTYHAGYGYTTEQEAYFRKVDLHLDNRESKGPFVLAFRNQKPYLVNDVDEIIEDLSERSRNLVEMAGARSFLCVPIVYENESMGVISLDNTESSGPPKQSDLNLLMGIAPQIAISIMNARSFERLQASEEKYRDLVESANSIIMRLDTQGRISFVNTYAIEFYGYEEHEMIGREMLGFLMPLVDAKGNDLSLVFADFLKNPDDYRQLISMNILKNRGGVWISWSNKAIFDKDGSLSEILCVGSDITQRMMAEEEKARLEMQLQRSQKMEAIGMLAGGVAHDLNNILSGVVSYPEILLMEVPEGSSMRKSLEVIKRSGEKAAAIVQDLLTLARRGLNISNAVNLNTVIRDFIRSPECSRILEYHENVRCELKLDPDLMNILGSEVHLSKTLMNLMSNAAEAMTGGGVVTVATENRYVDSLIHGFDLIEEGEYAVVTVSDTGIGIPLENLKQIFEPFYSKKVMGRSGTGLGMAVIWSTVKDHHGYIDVRSTVGKGSCFELYFPITRRELGGDDARGSLDALRGNEKILVIDDVDDQREIARKLLEKLGYMVDVAASGEEALKYLGESEADLILLDMIMDPGIDGLETYRRILKIKPGQRAIIVSGFSESDRVKETLDLGAGSYVKKPYRLHDMARAIRSELDKRR